MFADRTKGLARSRTLWTVAVVGLVAGIGMNNRAQAQDEMAVNTGAVSVSGGVDFTNQYWFRGLAQENEGLIAQPWIEVGVNLAPVGLDWMDVYGGAWNSIHSSDNVTDADGDGEPDGDQTGLFETDWYVGASFALPGNFSAGVSFTSLLNPAGGDIFAEEIGLSFAYDDSELWGDTGIPGWTGLQPYASLAFETAGGSDAGTNLGTYLELGVSPGFTLINNEDYPVSFSLPVSIGLSVDDYYEVDTDPTAGVDIEDETFGFVNVGAVVSAPLAFMPAEFGAWEAYAGVHALFLGDNTELISGSDPGTAGAFGVTGTGDDTHVYGVFGVSMSY